MSSLRDSSLSLSKLIRRRSRESFEDSVDEDKRLNIDYQESSKWKRGHFCWEAKGAVAAAHALLGPSIRAELNQSRKQSSLEMAISLFMVGTTVTSASPITVISSTDMQSRKDAKKAIERSGILTDTKFELEDLRHLPSGPIRPVVMEDDLTYQIPLSASSSWKGSRMV
jgi:hypothetical protein